eukprot:5745666-Alexandrium_andersonii.AAC.1
MPLDTLLLALASRGKKLHWMFLQLLAITALAIDTVMSGLSLPSDPVAAGVRARPRKRRDPALADSLLRSDGHKAPSVVEGLGKGAGLKGRW